MNKYVFIFFINCIVFQLQAQYTQIPDSNFENALASYDDIANDGQIPTSNIQSLTELVVNNKAISDLTGIEAFINLEELNVTQNNLTTLDLSSNTKLVDINIWNNKIETLNIQNLIYLEKLTATTNELTGLDVSTNIALKTLSISYNDIVSIDLSGLTQLEQFTAFRVNTLETVVLSNNTALYDIYIGRCKLNSLNVAACPNLKEIYLNQNNLTTLDFSNNPLLEDIDASKNQLTSIDLRTGNTQNFSNIDLLDNPNLTCISIDDPELATKLFTSEIDAQMAYSKDCNTLTFIFDDSFETKLIALGIDDIQDNHILNTNATAINSLDISNSNISNLSGISAFTNLIRLNASQNQLEEIDFSSNLLLQDINLSNNLIKVLDVSMLAQLTSVEAHTNQLFHFNLQNGNNTNITTFSSNGNSDLVCILVDDETFANTNFVTKDAGTSFSTTACTTIYTTIPDVNFEDELSAYDDVARDGKVPKLAIHNVTYLYMRSDNISDLTGIEDFYNLKTITLTRNNLSTVDFSSNEKLETLIIDSNNLTSIDVTNNAALLSLNLEDNNLSTIDLTGNPYLKSLNLSRNSLTSIDLTNNTILEDLELQATNLNTLDITKNTALVNLNLNGVPITSLDLSKNTVLEVIYGEESGIQNLNTTGLVKLEEIHFSEGVVSSVDFSTNTALSEINIDECNLTSLDLSNNLELDNLHLHDNANLTTLVYANQSYDNLREMSVSGTLIESIDLSNMPVLENIGISNTKISSLDVSQNPVLRRLSANDAQLEILNIKNGNNSNFTYFDASGNTKLTCIQVDDVDYADANFTRKDVQTSFSTDCESCTMNVRAILEGPFNSSEFEMNDDLRTNNLLPTTSPYEDGATCDISIFNTSNSSAVVDWVEIQLRSADDINEIVARKSFFLQKSSAVMNLDGSSPPVISAWQGSYYVAIAHRNHLTAVTSTPLVFGDDEANVDFTSDGSVLNGSNALVEVTNSIFALPAGNVAGNGQIQNSDINITIPQLGISSYSLFDVDMNGQVQNADIILIMQNTGKGEQF
ncbi:leucine-rich repeat domain-containing protein [Tenacibaculum aiptasiae]|uniref:leucine-rich repeat domain-containing protein n=1 Tax=Tenacibaculum aiptasiae TaxID=426481 RepID=UPI00232FD211|nr:hypothetical protein [Tenacibaculum aiptasiae]